MHYNCANMPGVGPRVGMLASTQNLQLAAVGRCRNGPPKTARRRWCRRAGCGRRVRSPWPWPPWRCRCCGPNGSRRKGILPQSVSLCICERSLCLCVCLSHVCALPDCPEQVRAGIAHDARSAAGVKPEHPELARQPRDEAYLALSSGRHTAHVTHGVTEGKETQGHAQGGRGTGEASSD
jgi:hypothetical protein